MVKVIRRSFGDFHHPKYSSLVNRIYASRGIKDPLDIDYDLKNLLPFHALKGIEACQNRLAQMVMNQERCLVIGDFDVDGATSTTIAVDALRAFGAKHVDFLLPDRFKFGYGLTPGIVGAALAYKPDVIITVDNGISSIDGVEAARKHGIDVIITDHHLPGESIPEDCIIVNPNQPGDEFPSKNCAGVGVIFYVMCALRSRLRENNWFKMQSIPDVSMAQYLDLVALGTVADVVPLDHNNRLLVKRGIHRMRAGLCRPGIAALLHAGGRQLERLRADDLGFIAGPRLNAAGRLEDMRIGVLCLLSDTYDQAAVFARELNDLNQRRKEIELSMKKQAFDELDKLSIPQEAIKGICVYDKTWHEGVVGLIASRIKDQYHRPTIAFAPHGDEMLKGSGRSIAGVHMRDVLADVEANFPGLMDRFGGHAMAVGLSLKLENLKAFEQAFIEMVGRRLESLSLEQIIYTDGELEVNEMSIHTTKALMDAGPFGQQFPPPCFDGVFELVDQRIVGQKHLKVMLRMKGGQRIIHGIIFNVDLDQWPNEHVEMVHIVYRLDINYYQGKENLQLIIERIEPQMV